MIYQLQHILQSIRHFVPETFLAISFLLLLLTDIILQHSRWQKHLPIILRLATMSIMLLALFLVTEQWQNRPIFLFSNLLQLDLLGVYFKLLVTLATLCVLVHIHLADTPLPNEFYAVLLAVLLGLYLMTMAVNGLSIYFSIEIVSVGGYMMVAFGQEKKASEGGLKYLLFGAMSSAIMLYGFSLLYGMGKSFDFLSPVFIQNLQQQPLIVVNVALLLSLSGILFKLSLVPFQVYAPDVYEAAPTPIAAFLSVVPKAATLLILVRFLSVFSSHFQHIVAAIALVSMLIGNLSALWQTNFKRLLAYSSIAQAGFVLVGVVANNQTGVQSAIFYMSVYAIMNLATFFMLDKLTNSKSELTSLSGLGKQFPLLSVLLTITLVALVGLPPTAGFMAKLLVFSALWQNYAQIPNDYLLLLLFVVGLLNAVISLFYYLKIPYYLFFGTENDSKHLPNISVYSTVWALVLTIPLLLLFFITEILFNVINKLLFIFA